MFSYTLRHSKKAKYLQLRLNYQGLEVIVPAGQKISDTLIEQFLQKKKSWIEKHKARCAEIQKAEELTLPTSIELKAFGESWEVIYLATQHRNLRLITNASRQIKILGNIADTKRCIHLLKQWVKKIAEEYLKQELFFFSEKTGLRFNTMAVRFTKTRWGSCSRQRNINLNAQLVFLPVQLMHHVLLHELCHIKYLHHKKIFWDLLMSFDDSAKIHAKQLKMAARYIPDWVLK